jgi:hypothetical protein
MTWAALERGGIGNTDGPSETVHRSDAANPFPQRARKCPPPSLRRGLYRVPRRRSQFPDRRQPLSASGAGRPAYSGECSQSEFGHAFTLRIFEPTPWMGRAARGFCTPATCSHPPKRTARKGSRSYTSRPRQV